MRRLARGMGWLATACLLGAVLHAGSALAQDTGRCAPGQQETFNVNQPGCSLCADGDGCDVECVGPALCICLGEDKEECCANTPCCAGCPDAESLECNVTSCVCAPGECCSLVCSGEMAPVASKKALVFVALFLGIAGVLILRRRATAR